MLSTLSLNTKVTIRCRLKVPRIVSRNLSSYSTENSEIKSVSVRLFCFRCLRCDH